MIKYDEFFIDDDQADLTVESVLLPGRERPDILFQVGRSLQIVSLARDGDKTVVVTVFSGWGAERFEIQKLGEQVTLHMFVQPQYFSDPWQVFVWESEQGQFDRLDIVAGLILGQGDLHGGLEWLEYGLDNLDELGFTDHRQYAHLLYQLALAHELQGDRVEAIALYHRIWADYPDSPYAYFAHLKLEPTTSP